MSYFNQANIEGKLCVDNKIQETFGDVYGRHVEMKSVFTFQPIKRQVSNTVKCAKPAATFSIVLFRTKNRQFCCLVFMVHIVLQDKRVMAAKKKQKTSPFLKKFLRRSQSSTTEL